VTTNTESPDPVSTGTLHLICVPAIQYVISQDVCTRAFIVVAHCPKLLPIIVRGDEATPAAMFAFRIEVTRACPFRAWLESNSRVKRIAAVAFFSPRFIAKGCRGVCGSIAPRTKLTKPPKSTSLRKRVRAECNNSTVQYHSCVCVFVLQSLPLLVCVVLLGRSSRRVGAFSSSLVCAGVLWYCSVYYTINLQSLRYVAGKARARRLDVAADDSITAYLCASVN
jgi:hypothetical protein